MYTHDYSVFSLGQRPVLMLRGKVIPNDGTARISITDIDRKHPLSCHLYNGNHMYQYGWFEHSTTKTVQEQFKIYEFGDNEFRDDRRGWSQRRVDNYLLLQKIRSTAVDGVFTCLLSHDVHPATAHLSIYYPSEL